MIRKDKLHIVLLVAVLLLCIAANGSVPTYEAGRTLSDLAGTAALADGPPEAGAEEAAITAPSRRRPARRKRKSPPPPPRAPPRRRARWCRCT